MRPIGEILREMSIERSASEESTHTSSSETVCPICKGAGYLIMNASPGSPNFSRLFPCDCKNAELKARSRAKLHQFSDLTTFRCMTFETFDRSVPGAAHAYDVALKYAQHPDKWLILVGSYGSGKTHLAAAIAHYALNERNMGPIIAVVPDLLDYLRTTFGPDSESTYDEQFNAFKGADLLILDDLGTENATPWAREKLFQIINYRYNERAPTVVTTNLEGLDRLDPRIQSRLVDWQLAQLCEITASDYRDRNGRIRRRRSRDT
ncbi:MAG TPA: ATP-binding protein [Thermomicrobiales bacterium]|nr:ATP-binding protein [Thermomicrobiales bacterium]